MASKSWIWIWVGLAGVAGVAGAVYYFQGQTPPEKPAQTEATPTPAPTAAAVKASGPRGGTEAETEERKRLPKKECSPRRARPGAGHA